MANYCRAQTARETVTMPIQETSSLQNCSNMQSLQEVEMVVGLEQKNTGRYRAEYCPMMQNTAPLHSAEESNHTSQQESTPCSSGVIILNNGTELIVIRCPLSH